MLVLILSQMYVVADTTKVRIFKQITTQNLQRSWIFPLLLIPQRYEFSSKSQHKYAPTREIDVVADTTKVRIFKQITTIHCTTYRCRMLLLIPQRYEFSSKSQLSDLPSLNKSVVADTTKVRIFKQITTSSLSKLAIYWLLLIPQRYEFSSKSQRISFVPAKDGVVADTTKVRIFKQITTAFDALVSGQ